MARRDVAVSFHKVRGRSIEEIYPNQATYDEDGWGSGVLFSAEPLQPGQRITVTIKVAADSLSRFSYEKFKDVSIGLTGLNPRHYKPGHEISSTSKYKFPLCWVQEYRYSQSRRKETGLSIWGETIKTVEWNPPSITICTTFPEEEAETEQINTESVTASFLEKIAGKKAFDNIKGPVWFAASIQEDVTLTLIGSTLPPILKPDVASVAALTSNLSISGHEHVMDVAKKFVADLNLPSGYLNSKFDVCFCTKCHASRGDNLKYPRGKPPVFYGLPIGWCKFGLKTKPQAEVHRVFEDWHVAFHGTRVQNLLKILDTGDLLLPGDVDPVGTELSIPKNHWDPKNPKMKPPAGHDVSKFYFSPSIRYAGCEVYARQLGWTDPKTGEKYHIRVAFQVRIKPGSYDVTKQTIGATRELDPLFPNSQLEWSTKRRGVVILVGLLVKVEGLDAELDVDMMKDLMNAEQGEPQASGIKKETHPGRIAPSDVESPGSLKHVFVHKTSAGVEIVLEKGDDCHVIHIDTDSCVILHPKVNEPVKIPKHYVTV